MRSDAITQMIRISVYEGEQLLETRECRSTLLPDQVPGVIWRGLAYPVLDGNRIDIAGPALIPSAAPAGHPSQTALGKFGIIEGAEEAYLLIQGSILDCEETAKQLSAAGIQVIRTGRYLGDPVDSLVADWFVRFEIGPTAVEPLAPRIGKLLDGILASDTNGGSSADLRLRLVESELASGKAREAALRAEIARLRLALTKRHAADEAGEARIRAEIDALQQALVEEAQNRATAEALALEAAPPPRATPPTRLRDEIAAVFESLLPRIRLLRGCSDVIAAEFSDRRFLYGALGDLVTKNEGMPANWKKLKGAVDWLERHISNGQDDAGRIYARLNRGDRMWDVLVSHKAEQTRDIAWLRTRS